MDNAYYRKEVVEWFEKKQWDFSISVTNSNNCRPVLDCVEGLPKEAWTPIRSDGTEEAIFSYHQPAKWQREQTYVVTRRWHDGKQWLLEPRYCVILVSRSDLPLKEMDIKICENNSGSGLVVGGFRKTGCQKSFGQYIALTENPVFF